MKRILIAVFILLSFMLTAEIQVEQGLNEFRIYDVGNPRNMYFRVYDDNVVVGDVNNSTALKLTGAFDVDGTTNLDDVIIAGSQTVNVTDVEAATYDLLATDYILNVKNDTAQAKNNSEITLSYADETNKNLEDTNSMQLFIMIVVFSLAIISALIWIYFYYKHKKEAEEVNVG